MAMWNKAVSMRILYSHHNRDLPMDRLAPESEPMTNHKFVTQPESTERLDRLVPDWRLHFHNGGVIDHILEVINKSYAADRRNASLSNSPRWIRPRTRRKTTLTPPQPLYFSRRRESSADQVEWLA
jgi:hypothetical protein